MRRGFTIVELVIVIVVIAILATISIVAYNNFMQRAKESSVQSSLSQFAKALDVYRHENSDIFPSDLQSAGIKKPNGTEAVYITNGTSYCLSLTNHPISMKVSSSDNAITNGSCSGILPSGTACASGFIAVPGNVSLGTGDFCVAKYEMKQASATVPVSQPTGVPWTNISQTDAISYSQNVAGCSNCKLITEAEWMTIAANILSVPSNWSGGTIGSGYVYSGHNDSEPSTALSTSSATADPYEGTNDYAGDTGSLNAMQGNSQKRTYTLSNGETIWDLSGNVWEWTQGTIGSGMQPGLSGETVYNWRNWNNSSVLWNAFPNSSRPTILSTLPGLSQINSWSATQGIGQLFSNYGEVGLRSYRRGGSWNGATGAGVLTIALSGPASFTNINTGFRTSQAP